MWGLEGRQVDVISLSGPVVAIAAGGSTSYAMMVNGSSGWRGSVGQWSSPGVQGIGCPRARALGRRCSD